MEGLAALLDLTQAGLAGFVLVFVRVSGVVALLPGFGEQMTPVRVRLGAAVAFAMIVWPMIAPGLDAPDPARPFLAMLLVEAAIGLMLGLAIRLLVIALQLAGITLAVASGLHVKAAIAMARSYEILPMGLPIPAADVAAWGTARVARAFALGFSLAAPFVIAGFAYNLALGAINRAMPQLMVAFIGAPAITAGGLLLLLLASPVLLHFWGRQLDLTLADSLALPR